MDPNSFRTLSAAVRAPMATFDYEHFLRAVALSLNVDKSRVVIITYSPTTDPNILIIDFAIVDKNRPPSESTAVNASNVLVNNHKTLQPLAAQYTVDSIIFDPTLKIPDNQEAVTVPMDAYRNVSNTPFIILVILMSIMFIVTAGYIIWHIVKGRHDRSLYAKWSPVKTWLSLFAVGTLTTGDKFSSVNGDLFKLDTLRHISATSCGPNHTFIVSSGKAYVTGVNSYGELGLGHRMPVSTLTENNFFSGRRKPLRVVCGDSHTLVLTIDGIFSFGNGSDGALGHGDYINREEPTRIEFFQGKKIRGMAAGGSHSIVLCDDGLYSFGAGTEGQLMHGDGETLAEPRLVEYFRGYESTIRQIVCGASHTFVLCNDWELYACGGNGCGQLGLGHKEDVWEPVQVTLPETTSYVYSVSSSYHTLVACDDGLYACGEGADYKLGLGEEKNVYDLTWVSAMGEHSVVLAVAGSEHSVVVTSNLDVYAWGRTTGGKLGDGEASDVLWEPTQIDLSGIPRDCTLAAIICSPTYTIFMVKEPEDEDEESDEDFAVVESSDGGKKKDDNKSKGAKTSTKQNPLQKYKKK